MIKYLILTSLLLIKPNLSASSKHRSYTAADFLEIIQQAKNTLDTNHLPDTLRAQLTKGIPLMEKAYTQIAIFTNPYESVENRELAHFQLAELETQLMELSAQIERS